MHLIPHVAAHVLASSLSEELSRVGSLFQRSDTKMNYGDLFAADLAKAQETSPRRMRELPTPQPGPQVASPSM
jgi:hypothetical protein